MIEKLFHKLQNVINVLTGILLAVLCVVIFCQVIARYVFGHSLAWSEELTRYMFVWIIYLGVSLGITGDNQFKIDLIELFVKGKGRKALHIFQHLLTIGACAITMYASFKLIKIGFLATSPTLRWPMWIIYVAFPIGFTLDIIALIFKTLEIVKNWNVPEITAEEVANV